MRAAFKQAKPDEYKKSGYAGRMWGAGGVVEKVSGGQNMDHLIAGQTLKIARLILNRPWVFYQEVITKFRKFVIPEGFCRESRKG